LLSYAEKFKEIAAELENTLEKITSFSVSAVSNSMLEETRKMLKGLEEELKLTQAKLKDFPEIKKDLQEMVLQCEQVK
jgi:predicted translin family RNA/ssDNA-binding protein